jgi:hypothetical protein
MQSPLDNLNFNRLGESTHAMLEKVAKLGYNNAHESNDGEITIKIHGLNCKLMRDQRGNWSPNVRVEWINPFILIPAALTKLFLTHFLGMDGTFFYIFSVIIGFCAAGMFFFQRKLDVESRLFGVVRRV